MSVKYKHPAFRPQPKINGDKHVVQFQYRNFRTEEHIYVVEIEAFEFGPWDASGYRGNVPIAKRPPSQWVMHGYVVTRDGDRRPEMGLSPGGRRRTFIMEKMRNLEDAK